MYFIEITTSIAFCLYLIDIYVQNDILVFCSQEKAFMCSIRGDLQRRSCLFISSTATSPVLSGSWICVSGRYHSDISNSTKKRWLHKDTVLSVGKDWNECVVARNFSTMYLSKANQCAWQPKSFIIDHIWHKLCSWRILSYSSKTSCFFFIWLHASEPATIFASFEINTLQKKILWLTVIHFRLLDD